MIDESNSIAAMAEAMCSLDGVSNVIIQLGSIVGEAPKLPQKVTPIRSLHEFTFSENYVNVKRVSNIGLGKDIRLQPIEFETKYDHKIVNDHQLERGKPKKFTLNPLPGTTRLEEDLAEPFDGLLHVGHRPQ